VFEIKPVTHLAGWLNRYNRSDKPDWVPPRSIKLLDQVRERVRYLHYSLQTDMVYVYWAKALVLWTAHSGGVYLPHALERKHPRAGESWAWFWVFPSAKLSVYPQTGVERRHHWFEE
jgi:hypothetical protein